jgi:tetratricopeptide (TPR) repeat protein
MRRCIVVGVAVVLPPLSAQLCREDCTSPDKVCICAFGSEPGGAESARPSVMRLGSFERELGEVRTALEPGDQVVGLGALELACPRGSRITVAGPYSLVVLPGAGQDCAFNLLRGTLHVLGEQATRIESGLVVMGSKRTHYGVAQQRRTGEAPRTQVFVYEGEALCRPDPESAARTVRGGSKVQVGLAVWQRSDLDHRDMEQTAGTLAWMDLAKARGAGLPPENAGLRYEQLRDLYLRVLNNPEDVQSRLQLARTQVALRIPRGALYQLDRAEAVLAAQDPRIASVAAARGDAYQAMGDQERARREFQRAVRINPDVLDPATRRRYRLEAERAPRLRPPD